MLKLFRKKHKTHEAFFTCKPVLFLVVIFLVVGMIALLTSAKESLARIVINSNAASLGAIQNLNETQKQLQDTFDRISEHLRNNKAGDDAQGLAINEKTKKVLQDIKAASTNAAAAASALQIAQTAVDKTDTIFADLKQLEKKTATASQERKASAAKLEAALKNVRKQFTAAHEITIRSSFAKPMAITMKKMGAAVDDVAKTIRNYFQLGLHAQKVSAKTFQVKINNATNILQKSEQELVNAATDLDESLNQQLDAAEEWLQSLEATQQDAESANNPQTTEDLQEQNESTDENESDENKSSENGDSETNQN